MSAKIVGFNYTTNENGIKNTTLHLEEDFPEYYSKPEAGRSCAGKKVSTVYVGEYDCTNLKIGNDIEIYYDKAISTKTGTFQPVKLIQIVNSK